MHGGIDVRGTQLSLEVRWDLEASLPPLFQASPQLASTISYSKWTAVTGLFEKPQCGMHLNTMSL